MDLSYFVSICHTLVPNVTSPTCASLCQVLVFDEATILKKPVEEWPVVNGFVSFFSHGFPLDKAIAYKNLRNPFIVNDLEMQYVLQDR